MPIPSEFVSYIAELYRNYCSSHSLQYSAVAVRLQFRATIEFAFGPKHLSSKLRTKIQMCTLRFWVHLIWHQNSVQKSLWLRRRFRVFNCFWSPGRKKNSFVDQLRSASPSRFFLRKKLTLDFVPLEGQYIEEDRYWVSIPSLWELQLRPWRK